jgi:phage terminase large subunit GpA-like protein
MLRTTLDHESRALHDLFSPFSAFKPPRRIPVVESAAQNLYFKQPGGIPGLWNADETPYMIEPMNMLASRRHEAVVFVGPARTGKTAGLLLGGMAHAVINDPGDMLMIQMTQDKAREFSKTDIDRAIRYSPNLQAMMGSSQDDNTHDKMFRHGMWLRIAWPTASNVSGSTYRYVLITDLDRMANAENVDGEGPLWKLGLKRTTTFQSRGMCLIESSPGIELIDPHWRPATAHEAPPATGILGIYNQSDRRRLYWQCLHCSEWFEASPGLALFGLPAEDALLEIIREADLESIAQEHNRIVCPHCSNMIGPRSKPTLNKNARWLQDGLRLNARGEVIGEAHQSTIAGYWMGGVAAAYQSWRSLVLRYLQALRDYALTSSEESLKTTVNTDQGMPYMRVELRKAAASTVDPASRKDKSLTKYVVPEWTRFVVASVDVQGGVGARFIVQVYAVGPHREKALIDRYAITESRRLGPDGNGFAAIDPARYTEDWDLITERVVRSTYRTPIDGIEMRLRMTVVDMHGEEGVTDKAYDWYRRMARLGLASRVMLARGVGKKELIYMPLIKESMTGARNKTEKDDIPFYNVNTNKVKDIVSNGLKRQMPGPGFVHIPEWAPQSLIDEIFSSEVRNSDGTWTQIRKRNEGLDGLVHCEVACLRLGVDRINWMAAPDWAKPIAENSDRMTRDERREMREDAPVDAATAPAQQPVAARPQRRVSRSRYLA